jgi:hypothetical protein
VARGHSESDEQIVVMDWLRLQYPEAAQNTMHIGNERKSSYYMGYIMKRMGVLKGASDLFMAEPRGAYHGLFIEMKSKTGKPTVEQLAFLKRMTDKGYCARLAYGSDEAIPLIITYLSQPLSGQL